MNIILPAIVPVILLLVLGHILRRTGFLSADFWSLSDKLTYFVLFPALLVAKVSQVNLLTIDFSQLLGFVLLYFVIISVMAYLIYRLTSKQPAQFSSIYQGVLRFNSYVYFAIIEAVWGQTTLATAALIAGIAIPMVNVCCVSAFAFAGGQFSIRKLVLSIVKNPLIIGALLGFVANVLPWLMPTFVFDTCVILSTAALPLALLSVGAAVSIKSLLVAHDGGARQAIWATSVARLCLVPMIALLLNQLLSIEGEIAAALMLFAATPTATSSYILSKQLGGDADMMATLISLQTVLSIVSLIFWLGILV